jgi:hypothetical protein
MRTYLCTLLCLFLFSCGPKRNTEATTTVVADSATVNQQPDTVTSSPTSVEQIKQHFGNINAKLQDGLLDSISYKYCNGERSGTVTYFSDKGKLAMIRHSYSEYSHFEATDQYFISNGNLFFAYLNRLTWSFESGEAAEGTTTDHVTEQRLYIANEKSLLCLEKKYTKRSHAGDNSRPVTVPNKKVDCKPIEPVIKDFKKLVDFKDSSNHDCLDK